MARRAAVPVLVGLEVVMLAVLVVVAVIGVLVAPFDRRLRLLRLAAMGGGYICLEWAGLVALLAVWLLRPVRHPDWWDGANVEVAGWVLGAVLGMARRTVGFAMEIDDPDRPGPFGDPDPVLVLARHGGIGDSFALVWLLATRYHRRPRVVLKRILQWDPLIDVVLSRMGACFLPPSRGRGAAGRGAGSDPDRSGRLDAQVSALAADLVPGDAMLLFPEGGNWTPHRRLRAIRHLWAARKPTAARAAALMDHVLPPRTGGVLACLETRPEIPVVIFAHTGLDKITSPGQLWDAIPFRQPMTVRWWPPAHPPYGEAEQVEWLTTEWAVVDEWIDSHAPSI